MALRPTPATYPPTPTTSPSTLFLLLLLCLTGCSTDSPATFHGTQWQKVTIDLTGPLTDEQAEPNPFTHYRADVTFRNGTDSLTVPAFFAADGRAAETGATRGDVWQVRFRPPSPGEWTFTVDWQDGTEEAAGRRTAGAMFTNKGSVQVAPAGPGERGRLVREHPRYLRWSHSGEYFLKAGTDSPENLLGYYEFDATYRHREGRREGEAEAKGLHEFAPHAADFRGGPTWQNGRGANLMGAVSYLAGLGVNSIYFLVNNIEGDGKEVWPFTDHETFDRYDVSKLDQWERVFDHADSLGFMLHFVLQETENETLLDGGDTGPLRSLYFRELVARFGHHRAVTWNLGEENGPNDWSETAQTTEQQRAMLAWFAANDPYRNHTVLHTHPGEQAFAEIYQPLLGNDRLGGLALQLGEPYTAHAVTEKWLALSDSAGAPWILSLDEVGPWYRGLDPDSGYTIDPTSNNQDSLRALTLWGNLMAGGAGVEWYFGYRNENNDLTTEDFRTRERAWKWTVAAVRLFQDHLPFHEMRGRDELVTGEAYCFGGEAGPYLVYLPFGRETSFTPPTATDSLTVRRVDPLTGTVAAPDRRAVTAEGLRLAGEPGRDVAFLLQP